MITLLPYKVVSIVQDYVNEDPVADRIAACFLSLSDHYFYKIYNKPSYAMAPHLQKNCREHYVAMGEIMTLGATGLSGRAVIFGPGQVEARCGRLNELLVQFQEVIFVGYSERYMREVCFPFIHPFLQSRVTFRIHDLTYMFEPLHNLMVEHLKKPFPLPMLAKKIKEMSLEVGRTPSLFKDLSGRVSYAMSCVFGTGLSEVFEAVKDKMFPELGKLDERELFMVQMTAAGMIQCRHLLDLAQLKCRVCFIDTPIQYESDGRRTYLEDPMTVPGVKMRLFKTIVTSSWRWKNLWTQDFSVDVEYALFDPKS